jgi:hypothetical protein
VAVNYCENMFYNWVASTKFNFMAKYGCLPELRDTDADREFKEAGWDDYNGLLKV